MIQLHFKQLDSITLPLVKRLYKAHYPSAKPKKTDMLLSAYDGHHMIALFRLKPIDNNQLLTGLLTVPKYRHQKVASQLLQHFCSHLQQKNTYCFAYPHLETFYLKNHFKRIEAEALPPSLNTLFLRYTQTGKGLIPMWYKKTT